MPKCSSLSWFVREALQAFVLEMEGTPQEFVGETVEHMKEDIVRGRLVRKYMEDED